MKEKEISLLNLQNSTTYIYIISLIISIYITSIDKENIKNNSNIDTSSISILNRLLVVVLSFIYLYITYKSKEISTKKGEDDELIDLQLLASSLSLISTIIVLYVVIKSYGDNYTIISGIDNPNL